MEFEIAPRPGSAQLKYSSGAESLQNVLESRPGRHLTWEGEFSSIAGVPARSSQAKVHLGILLRDCRCYVTLYEADTDKFGHVENEYPKKAVDRHSGIILLKSTPEGYTEEDIEDDRAMARASTYEQDPMGFERVVIELSVNTEVFDETTVLVKSGLIPGLNLFIVESEFVEISGVDGRLNRWHNDKHSVLDVVWIDFIVQFEQPSSLAEQPET